MSPTFPSMESREKKRALALVYLRRCHEHWPVRWMARKGVRREGFLHSRLSGTPGCCRLQGRGSDCAGLASWPGWGFGRHLRPVHTVSGAARSALTISSL